MGGVTSILLNGTVGAGKTTVAAALHRELIARDIPHMVIDLDEIRNAWPAPASDRFNLSLELRNLTAMVLNAREDGYERFVIAGVVEQLDELARIHAAVGSGRMHVCRLTADAGELSRRISERHADDDEGRQWHLARTGELDDIIEHSRLDDYLPAAGPGLSVGHSTIDTTGSTPSTVAGLVLENAGW
jgi:hypothetical protein